MQVLDLLLSFSSIVFTLSTLIGGRTILRVLSLVFPFLQIIIMSVNITMVQSNCEGKKEIGRIIENTMIITVLLQIDLNKREMSQISKNLQLVDMYLRVRTVAKRHMRSSMFTASFILVSCVKLP